MTSEILPHILADTFPLITGIEFERLIEDIRKNGLFEPIVLHEGKILDGRNRYKACSQLGINCASVEYEGDDPLGFVLSLNLHRRHLTPSQLAPIAIEIEKVIAEDKRLLEIAGVKVNRNPGAILPHGISPEDHAIKLLLNCINTHGKQKCFVYFAQGKDGGNIKIGRSDHPPSRLKQLQTGHGEVLFITKIIPGDNSKEASLHKEFSKQRVVGEWFKPTSKLADLANAIPDRAKKSSEIAGEIVGVSGRYVSDAKKIASDSEENIKLIKAGGLTIPQAIKEMKRKDLKKKQEENKKISSADVKDNRPTIVNDDYHDFLANCDEVDLLLTDPPYSTDIDDIHAFTSEWLPLALSKVTQRAYICIGAYPKELKAYLDVLFSQDSFTVDNPLIWTYRNTLGVTPKNKYNLNYQVILHLYTDDAPELDTSITNEMFSVQDINAPDGRKGDRFHTWQKPDDLANRLVRHSKATSMIDPFSCTGTFLLAGARHGLTASGCDIDEDAIKIARSRGCA